MGLGDLEPDDTTSSNNTNSSGGSANRSSSSSSSTSRQTLSGVGPGDFPVSVVRTPYLIIRETDGGYEDLWYPETPQIEVEYDWYSSFDYDLKKGERKVLWTEGQFKTLALKVQEYEEVELRSLIKEDTEKGLTALRNAAQSQLDSGSPDKTTGCAVCGERLHPYYDDYETVNRSRVCTNHTAQELVNTGVLD